VEPEGLAARVNLRSLMLERTTATIAVDDLDDTLAALFGTAIQTGDDLITTIDPSDDPAPASVWDKHLGTEAIGAAGERRRYSCVPGFNVGLRHLGQNEAYANGGAATPVSDTPVIWAGRRCAIYRVTQAGDGTWPNLVDLPIEDRVWFGTMRGEGKLDGRRYSFACRGPESWAGGNLGTGNFTEPLRALPISTLVDASFAGPTMMRASLDIVDLQAPESVFHLYLEVTDPDGTSNMGTVTGYTAVASALNTFLDQVIASTDQGTEYTNNADGNDIRFSTLEGADGITIRWHRGATGAQGDPFVGDGDESELTARLRLILHEDVWKLLGYDVRLQTPARDAVEHVDQYGRFTPVEFPAGYFQGLFYAASPKAMKASDENDFSELVRDDYSSGGFDRRWPPIYPGGTFTWSGEPGQEFQLDTADEVLLAGVKSRPLLEDPADASSPYPLAGGVGDVTRAGLFVLRGPYRARGDDDQNAAPERYAFGIDRARREGRTVQVIRACWRASAAGTVSTDSDGLPRLVVQEWLEPRLAGFDYLKLDGTWGGHRNPPEGAEAIEARPLSMLDYSDQGDRATTVMRRTLLSTGTAGDWFEDELLTTPVYGLGAPSAFLARGDNDDGGDVPGDAEAATLGVGVPASMVAGPEVWDALAGVAGVELSRCKAVIAAPIKSSGLFERLLAPTGLALGLSGGKFTPFDAWSIPGPEDAAGEVTTELYALAADKAPRSSIPKQGLRKWAPMDLVEVRGRVEPIGGDYALKRELRASDSGAQYRAQHVVHRVTADHLVHPLTTVVGASWQFELEPRWRSGFAFWGSNNSTVSLELHAEDTRAWWPGDGLLISDPWLPSSVASTTPSAR
ncbi:MAG: hypothetical protein ACYTFI_20220, partial [Planctomycetota bacterium]